MEIHYLLGALSTSSNGPNAAAASFRINVGSETATAITNSAVDASHLYQSRFIKRLSAITVSLQ